SLAAGPAPRAGQTSRIRCRGRHDDGGHTTVTRNATARSLDARARALVTAVCALAGLVVAVLLRVELAGVAGARSTTAGVAVALALLHAPIHGWQVLPLDLAVGVALGVLRVVAGSVSAPALAHTFADLAGWVLR